MKKIDEISEKVGKALGVIEKNDYDKFKEITDKMNALFEKKNGDYGNTFEHVYNIQGMSYFVSMLLQKVFRIKSVSEQENANFESIEDSLMDLANYAVFAIMCNRKN